jgi:hypothetical protein
MTADRLKAIFQPYIDDATTKAVALQHIMGEWYFHMSYRLHTTQRHVWAISQCEKCPACIIIDSSRLYDQHTIGSATHVPCLHA